MEYTIRKYIATTLIALYGLAISIVTVFMLAWDNKGAGSMWDKSTNDWFFTIWLAISTFFVWLGAVKCLSISPNSNIYLKILLFILILHGSFVILSTSKEAMLYLGLPHISLALGITIWWRNQQALTNRLSTPVEDTGGTREKASRAEDVPL